MVKASVPLSCRRNGGRLRRNVPVPSAQCTVVLPEEWPGVLGVGGDFSLGDLPESLNGLHSISLLFRFCAVR